MTLEELRNAVCRYIDENREAYNETGDECYRAVKEELLHILGLIDSVDHEPVGNPEHLTLKELARELRKLFEFGYLVAYGSELYGYRVRSYLFKPKYIPIGGFWFNATRGNDALLDISFSDLRVNLDLSEYKDADGNIDYSKCIVEVE